MMEMIQNYWEAVLAQDEEAMRRYLHPDALIRWHNTKEQFTREEFIRVNCEYPGKWSGKILHFFPIDNGCLTIVQVIGTDASFHVTSILHKKDSLIMTIDEYWGDDQEAPAWRSALLAGIRNNS